MYPPGKRTWKDRYRYSISGDTSLNKYKDVLFAYFYFLCAWHLKCNIIKQNPIKEAMWSWI